MYLIVTRSFPPEVGGMQNLMWGLANSLSKYYMIKVFADYHEQHNNYDESVSFTIQRVGGIKLLRKYRKAYLVNEFIKKNKHIKGIIADHWKSLELIKTDKKKICLIHAKEINHDKGSFANKRILKVLNNIDHVVSNSRYTKDLAIACGVNSNKIKIIKNQNLIFFMNSPNNPSGTVCKNLKEIAEVSKKYKLIILSDEIYSQLTFDNQYRSISNFYPESTIVSTGLSKWCGAGGWRLGFFAIPDQLKVLKNSLKILSSETFTSVSAPIQYAAIEAYKGDHSAYLNTVRKILSFAGNYVYENLKSNVINVTKPEGGFYLFPEFKNAKFSTSSEMCNDILNKTGVALLPGSDFGLDSNKMIARLSYTDFDGSNFLKNTVGSKNLDKAALEKYAPNIVEGVIKIKKWSISL